VLQSDILETSDGEPRFQLSAAQAGIWIAQRLDPLNPRFNLGQLTEIVGTLDVPCLERAIQFVVEEFETLQANIVEIDGEPYQSTRANRSVILTVIDSEPGENLDAVAELYAEVDLKTSVDVKKWPCLKFVLIRESTKRYYLYQRIHHIFFDGFSFFLFAERLGSVYSSLLAGKRPSGVSWDGLKELVGSDQNYRSSEAFAADKKFWCEYLGDFSGAVTLSHTGPDPREHGVVLRVHYDLPTPILSRMKVVASAAGVTWVQVLIAAIGVYVAWMTGKDDVTIGSAVSGRVGSNARRTPGAMGNLLPLRCRIDFGSNLAGLVRQVAKDMRRLLRHQRYRVEDIRRDLGTAGDRRRLFGPCVNYLPSFGKALAFEGCTIGSQLTFLPEDDLSVSIQEGNADSTSELLFSANKAFYTQGQLREHIIRFLSLLEELSANPMTSLRELMFLPREEREQLLERWNDTAAPYPQEQTLHGLFEEQAERTPEAVAVVYEDRELTYGELNTQANQLARHLIGLGVRPDDRVAICVERSVEMVVGLLAILKAGGAYVPLDPAYPKERLEYMLGDSAPVAVLAQAHTRVLLGELQVPVIDLEECQWHGHATDTPVVAQLTSAHLAYVIYTSGSTGMPKGVMIEHRNVVNLLCSMRDELGTVASDRMLSLTTLGFDIAGLEIYLPLICGAQVRVVSRDQAHDPVMLATVLEQVAATVVQATPSTWRMLVDSGWSGRAGLKALCGGEALSGELARRVTERVGTLWNVYGPTETTIWSVATRIRSTDGRVEPVSIGRPISNTRIYILDAYGRPVPAGVSGEIYIGGAGVGRGYLNRPELTAERFVADTFSAGADARMYRTGDLGRYLADGNIEYLGRNDDQVKIRGFRIELGEIEARLAAHEGVREAVVTAREEATGEKRLVAYYTQPLEAAELQTAHLRAHLQAVLPEYMVPGAFVRLQELPLTPNGKLDRKALPAPGLLSMVTNDYEAPLEGTEASLARIWGELLGVERVGRNDNFFELGGHSLLAVRLSSQVRRTFGVDLNMAELFARPILKETAQTVTQAGRTSMPDIVPVARHAALPLSFAQQRLWFLCQMEGVSSAYHMSGGVRLKGRLDEQALTATLDRIVARHESLRTTFTIEQGEPVQRVGAPDTGFALRRHDLGADADAQQTLSHLMRSEAGEDFDLEHGPLIRGCLIRLGEAEHVLLVTMHHIVSDGWSIGVLIRELGTLYKAFSEGREDPLDPLVIQYGDYAVWQREWLNGEVQQVQSRYWQESLSGAPALLELPADRARPAMQSYAGASVKVQLDEELSGQLKALGQRQGVTLFMTVLAGWAALLARLSGQSEVVIGSPVANRTRSEVEGLIGFFVNTLALRIDLSGNPSVEDLLERVKARMLGAQENQDLPFEQVVEAVKPVRSTSHSAVFQAVLAWQNTEAVSLELGDLQLEGLALGSPTSKFDLSLSLGESGEQIIGSLEYASGLFEQKTIERYRSYLVNLLREMVADASRPVGELEILPREEREQLLERWNDTAAPYPQEQTLHGLFEEQAERTPEAVAVVYEDRELTYGELNTQANQLARHLIGLGVRPDDRVAICVERSVEMVVGLLAILKAGGAYVPLDPAYPKERLEYMLGDSAPVAVLAQAHTRVLLGELQVPVIDLEECQWHGHATDTPVVAQLTSAHLAYVIYTSGSTGMPKGVMIEHRSIVNRLLWMQQAYGLTRSDSVLQKTPFSFDVSVWEFFWTLSNGARLVVARAEGHKDPVYLKSLIEKQCITVMHFVPSMLDAFLAQPVKHECRTLVRVFCSGEALPGNLVRRFKEQLGDTELDNLYGPTEAAVDVTAWNCKEALDNTPIGRPISNTRIYILDAYGRPVPAGVSGEIYIGGAGVGRGYLNRPELTAERFVADTFSAGADARMYRTGDLGRYLADGNIEYLGRNDDQVKIRGFRIELGEIEARLAAHEGVREAVVTAREEATGEKRLVAYYTQPLEAAELQTAHLRAHLQAVLPEYMVPGAFVRLQELPLTPNGKLDRKALPAPERHAYVSREYEAPEGEIEVAIAGIWQELLGIECVGRHDHFFELGGHSLLAVRVIARMRQAGLLAEVSALFGQPTLAALAAAVGGGTELVVPRNEIPEGCERITPQMLPLVRLSQAAIDGVVANIPGGARNVQDIYPLAPLQEGILYHHLSTAQGDPYLLKALFSLEDRKRLEDFAGALQGVIARHDVLRTSVLWEGLEEPVQVVWREAQLEVQEVRLDGAEGDIAEQLQARFDPRQYRLDLKQAPLLRLVCAQDAGNSRWIAMVLFHHLVLDHAALEVVQQEMQAYLLGEDDQLPQPVPYRNYVAQARLGVSQDRHDVFFREMLEEIEEPTLPFGLEDVQGDGRGLEEARQIVEKSLGARLREQARQLGVSAASLHHLAWALVVGRAAEREDVVFGTVLLGRMQGGEGTERALGLFINTLPIRVDIGADVRSGVVATHTRLMQLLDHEHASLALAQRCSGVAAPLPLFSALLNYRHGAVQDVANEALTAWQGIEGLGEEERTNYPLTLSVDDWGADFGLTVQSTDGIGAQRVCGYMHTALQGLVDALEHAPHTLLSQLEILPREEREQLLERWNDTAAPYPQEQTLHGLFEEQAERTPEAVAVVYEDRELTYGELNTQANQLARHLIGLGVRPDDRVAICVERSVEMVVGLLAILKAGGAYVPLDPAYPKERLEYMLGDSAPVAVLAQAHTRVLLGELQVPVIDLEECQWHGHATDTPVVAQLTSAHLAYVIYTSGSTGMPKGVMIEHRNVVNLLCSMRDELGTVASDRMLSLTTLGFDIAGLEIYLPLICGAQVRVVSRDQAHDPVMLATVLEQVAATVVQATPSTWRMLVDSGWSGRAGLKALCGGEALSGELARRVTERVGTLWNVYGPTETTIWSVATRIRSTDGRVEPVSIGRPISNTRIYILDAYGRPVPAGVSGEIYIGGAGVGRGYLNRPELTAERFVADTFSAGADARMYRTGDLGRYLADGNIEYLGRNDDQVKIRGFRIELGEIEARLAAHEGVREAVVTAREEATGEKRLVAYYTQPLEAAELQTAHLRAHLQAVLPEYMVPGAFVRLQELPLTPNGKLDRKALPAPNWTSKQSYIAPRSLLEHAVQACFAEVLHLNVDQVSVLDDFFQLGGDSMLAMKLIARLNADIDCSISVRRFLESPTVADIAADINIELSDVEFDVVLPIRTAGTALPLFCIHSVSGLSWSYSGLKTTFTADCPIYALQSQLLARPNFRYNCIAELAADHIAKIREIQPSGPYHLLGWSYGGLIAHEIATQLESAGEEVGMLAIMDTRNPEDHVKKAMAERKPDNASIIVSNFPAILKEIEFESLQGLTETEQTELLHRHQFVAPSMKENHVVVLFDVLREHLRLMPTFVPKKFNGTTVYFSARTNSDDQNFLRNVDTWRDLIGGPFINYDIDCIHTDMCESAPLSEIGALLKQEREKLRVKCAV
jgi:amino acid adenylation domain-containing protein